MSSSQSALPSLRLRCRDEKGVVALKLGGLADPQAAPLTAVGVNVSVTDVNDGPAEFFGTNDRSVSRHWSF